MNCFCYHCGADWSDWPTLSDQEREKVMKKNPEARPGNLPEACPSCGIPYDEERMEDL